ncbi:metal-dependent hydrolase [Candidatus Saccharibacteria bacterium]|nr:metal-dependent hydrolase [Candidatus Saccharibacteria bacterium]
MANYKGHTAGGFVAGALTLAGFYALTLGDVPDGGVLLADYQLVVGTIVLGVLFGLWPDVDTNSKAQDLFFGTAFLADIYLLINEQYTPAAFLGLIAMTPIVGTHRGWTHKKWAMVLVPLPILIIPYLATSKVGDTALLLYFASVAGYFSHLLLDGLIVKWIRVKGGW